MHPFPKLRALTLLVALGGLLVPSELRAAGAPAAEAAQAPAHAGLIGDWPRPGSDAAKADQAILLWLQATRTPEETARAQAEVHPHLGLFSAAAGADLEGPGFPLTRALCEALAADLRPVTGALKAYFARPRPYLALPEIQPAVARATGDSYPSEHSSWGVSQALLLAALAPGRRQALLDRGRQIGYDRVLGGVHYPSDVRAGQKLGAFLAEAWLADPVHRQRIEQARGEWR